MDATEKVALETIRALSAALGEKGMAVVVIVDTEQVFSGGVDGPIMFPASALRIASLGCASGRDTVAVLLAASTQVRADTLVVEEQL